MHCLGDSTRETSQQAPGPERRLELAALVNGLEQNLHFAPSDLLLSIGAPETGFGMESLETSGTIREQMWGGLKSKMSGTKNGKEYPLFGLPPITGCQLEPSNIAFFPRANSLVQGRRVDFQFFN